MKQESLWSLLVGFLRAYMTTIVVALTAPAVFTILHLLGMGDIHELGYALFLTGFGYLGVFCWAFARYCVRRTQLNETLRQLPPEPEALPASANPIEDGFRRIAIAYQRDGMDTLARNALEERERIDYYTLWMHQIKTPIAAMDLMAQSDAPIDKALLRQELFKIAQYADAALSFQRLRSMENDLSLQYVPLYPLCRNVVRKLRALFLYKHIKLDMDAFEDSVLSDAKWLAMVLTQVLTNALKYTPDGGTIAIRLRETHILEISDTGIGICAEDIPRVFERGFTGAAGRAGDKSTGIGLYLCREACKKLGHTIALAGAPDEGVTVTMDMRRADFAPF